MFSFRIHYLLKRAKKFVPKSLRLEDYLKITILGSTDRREYIFPCEQHTSFGNDHVFAWGLSYTFVEEHIKRSRCFTVIRSNNSCSVGHTSNKNIEQNILRRGTTPSKVTEILYGDLGIPSLKNISKHDAVWLGSDLVIRVLLRAYLKQ